MSPISSLFNAGIGFDGMPLPEVDEPVFEWPVNGEQIDVIMVVTGGGEWELEYELCEETTSEKIFNVVSDTGCGLDEPIFIPSEFPKRTGRYRLTLEFWFQNSIDWESGHNDPDYGFVVIRTRRLGFMGFIERALAKVFHRKVASAVPGSGS